MSPEERVATYRECEKKAAEYSELAAELHALNKPSGEVNYYMLCAVYEAINGLSNLLAALVWLNVQRDSP